MAKCIVSVALLCFAAALAAQTSQGGAKADFWQYDPSQKAPEKPVAGLLPAQPAITHHQLNINGQVVNYTATAATLPIRNATSEAAEGEMFFIYYSKDGAADASKRPLMFLFNGGPGSAAVWLHMLGFGPKRVNLNPDGTAPPPPYVYKDNPNTLLDQADLVFIDPIGTGYSRPATPADGAKHWGMENDVASVAEFMRLFLSRYERWASPKYILGESYGTYRAAELASYLIDRGIGFNGVILLSSLFEDSSRAGDSGDVNFMPTFILTAWYHKRLPPDLQQLSVQEIAKRAEEFASGEYATALYQGARLRAEQRQKVIADISRYTGLSKTFIENNDMRVSLPRFMTELLREKGLVVGRLDGRMTAFAADAGAVQPPFDPADANVAKAVVPVFEDYVRTQLNYKTDRIYYVSRGGIGNWPGIREGAPAMENAFARNPYLRLFVVEGYFDLATIYYGFEWSLAHLRISPQVRARNITVGRYQSGHMIYTDATALQELRSDLRKWLQ